MVGMGAYSVGGGVDRSFGLPYIPPLPEEQLVHAFRQEPQQGHPRVVVGVPADGCERYSGHHPVDCRRRPFPNRRRPRQDWLPDGHHRRHPRRPPAQENQILSQPHIILQFQ